jgi:uncharacterized membrane protein YbhN (UPF0104 family)
MRAARRWLWLGAWLVTTLLLVFVLKQVSLARVVATLQRASAPWLGAAIATYLIILPLGATQWRAMLPSSTGVSWRRVFHVFALTSVANNTTPSIIGHATGVVLLAAEPGVGRSAALSVLALDQVAVGLVKIVVLLLASALVPLPAWMRDGLQSLAAAVGLLVALVGLAAFQHGRVERWAAARAPGWTTALARIASDWARDLEAVRSPRRFAVGVACAAGVKATEAFAIVAMQGAFGLHLSFSATILVLAATALATFVPFAPANLGVYESATFAAYRLLGVDAESALAIAFAQHACQWIGAVSVGYVLLTTKRPGGGNSASPAVPGGRSPQRP